MARPVHDAHAAAAEHPLDLIAGDGRARRPGRHGRARRVADGRFVGGRGAAAGPSRRAVATTRPDKKPAPMAASSRGGGANAGGPALAAPAPTRHSRHGPQRAAAGKVTLQLLFWRGVRAVDKMKEQGERTEKS